ncbi:unnamed protein product [Dicrocoelium dendriticum]|nr:unnamed protein product [Dicrocoelium dendriticum]
MSEDFSILTNCRKRQYGSLNESSISDRLCHSHNIGSGDTLTSIAVQYGTTVQHLKLLNHLWTSDITNLKTIRVPASVNTNYDNFDNNEVIEMRSIKANRPVSGETASSEADYWDPSYYYKNLFARIERVKDAASSFLQNRRLSEVLSDTGLAPSSTPLDKHSSSAVASAEVMVKTSSSSSSSLDSHWRASHS